ncbi:MAG: FecR domain-containing protein [Spirochaetes bacterium]|nr:FecR domain-containing protein [Spirochaetota bacterium]
MGIDSYINALLDRKRKPAGTGGPVDRITVRALARHADETRAADADRDRTGSCLTDNEMAAYIELKKDYQEYDRALRHMAVCARCRTRAVELTALLLPDRTARKTGPPADVIARAFTEARTLTAARKLPAVRRLLVPLAAAAVVAIALSGLLYHVLSPPPHAAYITFFVGTVELTHAGKPAAPAVKRALGETDSIITGANSFVLVQVDETIVFKIAENTSVTMKSLLDKKRLELFMTRGTVLSRVAKLSRNAVYRVATPTMVAAVKGTEFSVRYTERKTAILAVRKGAVGATAGTEGKESLVRAGTTAVFTGREKRRRISDAESRALEDLSKIPVIPGIGSRSEADICSLIAPIPAETAKPGTTLEELAARYGHIHTVSLYNGKVIEGVILHRGKRYRVLTPEGEISIPERQIRATRARYVREPLK